MSTSSRNVSGRTPLSLMSYSTRFSHVDCIRSMSNSSMATPKFLELFWRDVSAADDGDSDARADARQRGGDGRGAGGFGDDLRRPEQPEHGVDDLLVLDGHDVVDEPLRVSKGQ